MPGLEAPSVLFIYAAYLVIGAGNTLEEKQAFKSYSFVVRFKVLPQSEEKKVE